MSNEEILQKLNWAHDEGVFDELVGMAMNLARADELSKGWISVDSEERKKYKDKTVLVFVKSNNRKYNRIEMGRYWGRIMGWLCETDSLDPNLDEVITHWRPLPPAPSI